MQFVRSDASCRWYHHSTHPTPGKPINPCVHNAPLPGSDFHANLFSSCVGKLKGKVIYSHPIHGRLFASWVHRRNNGNMLQFTQFSHQTEMREVDVRVVLLSPICIMPDDLLTVNNDRCSRIIMLLKHSEPKSSAILSFSVADNDGLISSGCDDPRLILMQCCTRCLFTFGILRLLTNDRKMILNLF